MELGREDGHKLGNPMIVYIVEALFILLIVKLIKTSITMFFFLLSLSIFVLLRCLLRCDCNPSMLISCIFASLVKFYDNSSMTTFQNFAILVRFDCNCGIPTCCTFAFRIIFNFNSSMSTSFIPILL